MNKIQPYEKSLGSLKTQKCYVRAAEGWGYEGKEGSLQPAREGS